MSEQAHHTSHSPLPYLLTLIALLILTGVTVGAAYVDFGSSTVNIIIAMLIATVKASLVALIFMHLRHDKALNSIIFVSSLIFLGILLGFCMIDLGSRERVYPTGLRKVDPPPTAAPAAAPTAAAPAKH
ncbi:MAG: cytochrome C oxidase subunit IV family protein [Acidobacteria bacterium]|jgi:caa(3)-type oxidase subunit IV|nr:cytochrome C oxidase subunit IV family protein [Acidobacteriota bacterium]